MQLGFMKTPHTSLRRYRHSSSPGQPGRAWNFAHFVKPYPLASRGSGNLTVLAWLAASRYSLELPAPPDKFDLGPHYAAIIKRRRGAIPNSGRARVLALDPLLPSADFDWELESELLA